MMLQKGLVCDPHKKITGTSTSAIYSIAHKQRILNVNIGRGRMVIKKIVVLFAIQRYIVLRTLLTGPHTANGK